MPLYEYRCRECGATFEQLRAADTADAAAPCPQGHDDTVRLLSLIARHSGAGQSSLEYDGSVPAGGCGSGCACAH